MFKFLKNLFSVASSNPTPANTPEQLYNYDNFVKAKKPDIDKLLVGVSFSNADGKNRQDLIGRLRLFETVYLKREQDNPYSNKAVALTNSKGDILGYFPDSYRLHERIDKGQQFHCVVGKFVGFDQPWHTKNIVVWGYLIAPQTS